MKFENYLDINYVEYTSDKRHFVWGWDEDIFYKNIFAQAYFYKNQQFMRDIKLSILLNQIPNYIQDIFEIIDRNKPLLTALKPAFMLTYNIC